MKTPTAFEQAHTPPKLLAKMYPEWYAAQQKAALTASHTETTSGITRPTGSSGQTRPTAPAVISEDYALETEDEGGWGLWHYVGIGVAVVGVTTLGVIVVPRFL